MNIHNHARTMNAAEAANERVVLWNTVTPRKVAGNSAPDQRSPSECCQPQERPCFTSQSACCLLDWDIVFSSLDHKG